MHVEFGQPGPLLLLLICCVLHTLLLYLQNTPPFSVYYVEEFKASHCIQITLIPILGTEPTCDTPMIALAAAPMIMSLHSGSIWTACRPINLVELAVSTSTDIPV